MAVTYINTRFDVWLLFKEFYGVPLQIWYWVKHGMEWIGMEWNGMEWNGLEWNGMEFYSILS